MILCVTTVTLVEDLLIRRCLRSSQRAHARGVLEVCVDIGIILVIGLEGVTGLLGVGAHGLLLLPVGAHVVHLGLEVELWVVVLADSAHALPEGEMSWVNGHTVVLVLATLTNVLPAALLLLKVETGGVWQEEEGEEHTGETEPWDEVELGLRADVIVKDGGKKGSKLSEGSCETVGGGTDWGRETFGGNEEGDCVWTKLVEERGEVVHGLERLDVGNRCVVGKVEGWDDEKDEVHQETELHHVLAAIKLVINQEGWRIVSIREMHEGIRDYLQAR